MLTIGSLFAGIGGLELGLERAGLGPVVWQVEIDPFCQQVLARHWPDAERFPDVRRVGSQNLEVVDVVAGGFPCVGISDAGRREGLDNEESALWWEFARVVAELRPRYVVIENVAALRGRGLTVVLGQLAACGYDAVWDCIPAAAVGAPHRRDRLFVVAWRVSDTERYRIRIESERGSGSSRETDSRNPFAEQLGAQLANAHRERDDWREDRASERLRHGDRAGRTEASDRAERAGEAVVDTDCGQCHAGGQQPRNSREHDDPGRGHWPPGPDDMHAWRALPVESQPSFCRITHGVPRRVDRLRALGNAVVPAVAEVIGRVVMDLAHG